MSTALGTEFAQTRARLSDLVAQLACWPSAELGFARFIYSVFGLKPPTQVNSLDCGTTVARLTESPVLAAAGYCYELPATARPPQFDSEWGQAFERLTQRDPFPADRESFFFRPVDLLGISIGAMRCPDLKPTSRDWLRSVLAEGGQRIDENNLWAYWLSGYAAWMLGSGWRSRRTPAADDLSLTDLCLLKWLSLQQEFSRHAGLLLSDVLLDTTILKNAFRKEDTIHTLAEAVIVMMITELVVDRIIESAVERSLPVPVDRLTAERIVSTICRRFPLLVKQLATRHDNRAGFDVTDEYDVQDILHALLRLHFEDVRPEEWTPSYGGAATRMDFLLKREQVVVEAKMTRRNLDQKKIISQLSEDIERYRAHPDCRTLCCFVFDPEGRCQNPTALEDDLAGQRDGLKVVIIVSPK